ncbi:hypothetical protein [Sphingomonas melonis]|jgi:hypothetical protein|uniref:Uncharacterized protein n=1 Tax=Sphingomonas melonis TaxID=152682 RepID=A0A7Y9FN13_9SPHN|nr:hypothetical protein [Sphingomonas melonis]NYD90264.1 hypothetical protein [Sphingomonas melonis]
MTDPNRPDDQAENDHTIDPLAPTENADTEESGAGYGNHGEGQGSVNDNA